MGQSHKTNNKSKQDVGFAVLAGWLGVGAYAMPMAAFAQASPFNTGATSLLNFALTIATPIAAIIVVGLAIAARSAWRRSPSVDRAFRPSNEITVGRRWGTQISSMFG